MSAAVKAVKARAAKAKAQESLLPNTLDDILKSPHHVALAA